MNYIVKSCPSFDEHNTQCLNTPTLPITEMVLCQDCTDCVIKQVIQVCNEYSDKWEDCDFSNGLSYEILKLFNVEEVK